MHEIEPFDGWLNQYDSNLDERLPFFGETHDQYDLAFYNHLLHPEWDFIGSETLFVKVLYASYDQGWAVIEMIGEWNDTLHNDSMHLKRNLIDFLLAEGIRKFILIGENILNFHGGDDDYYQEWFEEVEEEGWIATICFRDFIHSEWKKHGLDGYFNWGGNLEIFNWRTLHPVQIFERVDLDIRHRISQ